MPNTINAIKKLIALPEYQSYLTEREYRFEKLKVLYEEFINSDIGVVRNQIETDIIPRLEAIKSEFKFQAFIDLYQNEPAIYRLLQLIGFITVYIDLQAYNKNVWNEYPDKRTFVASMFNMRHWLLYFIRHKLGIERASTVNQYTNAIVYVADPGHSLSMMSEGNRERVAGNLLQIPYNHSTFPSQLIKWFRDKFKYTITNPLNETIFINDILYRPEIKALWDKDIQTTFINLAPGQLVYKVSMGTKHFSDEIFDDLIDKNLIVVHGNTEPLGQSSERQGDIFTAKMKVGDYVYVCRGNARFAVIGKITGDAVICDYDEEWGEEGWMQRSFMLVKSIVKESSYNGIQKWWAPNFRSTCYYVKPQEIELANDHLFLPFFDTKFVYRDTEGEVLNEQYSNSTNNITMLNTILYGPPGTGKTFHTINEAIAIIEPDFDFEDKSRDEIKDKYNQLVKAGHIEFCTFHQSMSYEDFIEGIKPVKPGAGDTYLKYEIKDGIMKRLAKQAAYVPEPQTKVFSISDQEFTKAQFYKMSLGDSKDTADDAIFQYCMDNGYLALGWGDNIDFTGKSESEITKMGSNKEIEKYEAQAVNYFIHAIKKENYVIISNGNLFLRAIGKVIGNYEFKGDSPIRYHQFRKVEWILKDVNIPVEELYDKIFSQQSIYQLNKREIKKEFFVKAEAKDISAAPPKPKNYVLIIDEINRGNVSSIFGELITLIEDDKRAGKPEALDILLPYSGEKFSIPSNLHIIGTMNTADRSVEALDTALRRRFGFKFMPPEPNILRNNDGSEKMVNGISLKKLLETINERIAYLLDEDHQIGHSYFYDLADNDVDGLIAAFRNKIIPLLKEYFYNDYEKIMLVLGSSFVTEQKKSPIFAGNKKSDIDRSVFVVKDIEDSVEFIKALKLAMNEQP